VSAGELRTATRSVWRPSPEALVASLVFVLSAVAITVTWERLGDAVTDIALYQTYGERLAGGLVPYRDFGFEYPPGALPAIVLPALVTGTVHAYRIAFVAELALVGVVAVLLLDAVLRRLELPRRERILSLAVVALAPLLLGGVILTRFDLVPAALVLAALALAVAGRRRAAALVVGVGAAVKLYPAILLPPLAIDAWRRGGRRELAIVLGLAVAPVALAYIAFFALAPDGVLDSLGRQIGRPLQIESVGAGLLLALHQAFGMGLGWTSGSGSQNLTGTGAGVLAALQGVVQVVAVVLVWVAYARGPSTAERLVRYGAASVVAFVALSKVLSPQFLVWLVLLVPLVGGPRRRTALALTAVACALTAVWFPARYWDLVRDFDPLVSWLVLLRGLVLLGLLAALTWPATEPAPSRSPSPVPSPGRT
jgi:glycosyl transferase family 87